MVLGLDRRSLFGETTAWLNCTSNGPGGAGCGMHMLMCFGLGMTGGGGAALNRTSGMVLNFGGIHRMSSPRVNVALGVMLHGRSRTPILLGSGQAQRLTTKAP